MRELSKSLFMVIVLFAGLGVFITSCGDDDEDKNPPTASFTFVATDLAVTFTNTSTGGTTYSWDFGDAGTSTEESPTYTYAAAGTYTAKLTATNADGSDTAEESVTVEAGVVDNCETADNLVSPDINYTWATNSGDAAADAFFEGFGGYVTERIANPDQTGNESCYVMKLTRGTGCEVWGGAGQLLPGRADFSAHPTTIKLDVWGAATDVTLVFENMAYPDNTPLVTRVANMTKTDEWETLTFDFSDDVSGDTYGNLILYITRNQAGCADEVYYVDNLIQE
ncbi:MAG: hypothetical protein ACJA1A_000983 [Saprospiraceae bacterium]|jgi:hypothetical protein